MLLCVVRDYYMDMIGLIFPTMKTGSVMPAVLTGGALFIVVSVINMIAIRRKVMNIWHRRN